MNGEMYQICMIVSAARNALKRSCQINFENDDYVECIDFQFLPQKKLFRTENYIAHNVNEWFTHCTQKGMTDIKMLCPVKVDNRQILGFANTGRSSMVVFYSNQKVTYWTAVWEFLQDKKKWKVLYVENEWEKAPKGKPIFENNTECFEKILAEIANFADEIEFSGFAETFRSALRILEKKEEIPETYPNGRKMDLPQIAEDKKRIFFASSKADVFGAMGSWNDSPPYYANKKGLHERYEKLSDELLKQMRLAMLYAVNED